MDFHEGLAQRFLYLAKQWSNRLAHQPTIVMGQVRLKLGLLQQLNISSDPAKLVVSFFTFRSFLGLIKYFDTFTHLA